MKCIVCYTESDNMGMLNGEFVGLCDNCMKMFTNTNEEKRVYLELEKIQPKKLFSFDGLCSVIHLVMGDNSPLYKIKKSKNFPLDKHFVTEREAESYLKFDNVDIMFIRKEI